MSSEASADRHKPGLDAIRGLAVLLVILTHWGFLEFGWIGVQLFFVLSGYLISSILIRERSLPLAFYLKRFYWRRTLRIFPLYYAYLLALTVITISLPTRLFVPERHAFERYAVSLFTYTFNYAVVTPDFEHSFFFTHFWSLAVEEQFYLVWPLLVSRLSPGRLRRLLWFVVLLGAPLARFVTCQWVSSSAGGADLGAKAAYLFTPGQLDAFAAGSLLACAHVANGPNRGRWPLWGLAALVATAVIHGAVLSGQGLGEPTAFGFPSHMPWNYQYVWGYSILNLGCVSLIALVSSAPEAGGKLDRYVLGYLGRRSYALYVFHWPLVNLFGRFVSRTLGLSHFTSFLLYLPVLILSVEVSWRLLEAPLLKIKDRRFRRPEPA